MRIRTLHAIVVCLAIFLCAILAFAQSDAGKPSGDKARIEALYDAYAKAFKAKDVNALMANYDPSELFVFDVVPPREYPSWDAYKKDWEGLFAALPGPLDNNLSELDIKVVGAMAYARNIQTGFFTAKDGSRLDFAVRVTDVLRKVKGKWLIVQEHVSVPVDMMTGKADVLSKP